MTYSFGEPVYYPTWFALPTATSIETGSNIARLGLPVEVEVYPNPTNEEVLIEFHLEDPLEVQIVGYDILGREFYSKDSSLLLPGLQRISIDSSELSPGLYTVILRSGQRSTRSSFIVVK